MAMMLYRPTIETVCLTFRDLNCRVEVQHDFSLPDSPAGPDEIMRVEVEGSYDSNIGNRLLELEEFETAVENALR